MARWPRGFGADRVKAGVAALTAGLAAAASEVVRSTVPAADDVACDTGPSYAINAVDLVRFVGIGFALLLLARLVWDRLSSRGRTVALVGAVASMVTGVANGVEHCVHLEALGLVYVLGLMVSVLATIGFGLLLARAGRLPQWIGWSIALGTLAFFIGAEQGWGRPVVATAWVVVGVGLLIGAARAERSTTD